MRASGEDLASQLGGGEAERELHLRLHDVPRSGGGGRRRHRPLAPGILIDLHRPPLHSRALD